MNLPLSVQLKHVDAIKYKEGENIMTLAIIGAALAAVLSGIVCLWILIAGRAAAERFRNLIYLTFTCISIT